MVESTRDSLNQKSPHIIAAYTKGTIYNYDLKLREDSSFDILYTSTFGTNLDLEVYHGHYERRVDTVELFFTSQKPDIIDTKYIVNGYLKSYNGIRDLRIIE